MLRMTLQINNSETVTEHRNFSSIHNFSNVLINVMDEKIDASRAVILYYNTFFSSSAITEIKDMALLTSAL